MDRYNSYKDSGVEWIGEIPNTWEKISIKHLVDIKITDGPHLTPNFIDKGGIPFLSVESIQNSKIDLSRRRGNISVDDHKEYSKKCKPIKNDILLVKSASVGKLTIVDIDEEFNIWSPLSLIRINKKGESKFYFYFFHTDYFQTLLILNSVTNTQPNIGMGVIENLRVLSPPLSEQQQIVSFLDDKTQKIDSLIQQKEKKIELLKEKRTSLINHVVTKGLDSNVEMKDSGVEWIGEIPSHYQMISIKFLVTTPVTDGPHETPVFVDEGIPFLSVNGVVGNKINFNKVRGYITNELHIEYSKKCKPQRDDVLLVKSGSTTGKSTIVETDLNFNIWSPLCIIRSNTNKIIPRFTFHTFQSGYFIELIENNWSYGTQPNIGMNVIENLSIVVPPISEQQQIVEYLDKQTEEIDTLIQLEQKKIDTLKEYRQSLISEVVTGKIRVCEEDDSLSLNSQIV